MIRQSIANPIRALAAEIYDVVPAKRRAGGRSMNDIQTGSTLEPMVRKLSYWTKLDDGDRAAILALPFNVKMVERNHDVVREREQATHSCLMLSGYSVRTKIVG